MAVKLKLRTADTLARKAEIIDEGIAVWDREEAQLYVHDGETAGGLPCFAATPFEPDFKEVSATTNTTETIYLLPKTTGVVIYITLGSGSGSFTKPVVLMRETRAVGASSGAAVANGTRVTVVLECTTTSAGRIVEIRDNSAVGDTLDTFESDADGAFSICADYVYDTANTQWRKLGSARQV